MCLVDVVSTLIVEFVAERVRIPYDQKYWDQLLYELKSSERKDVPSVIAMMDFDWDCRYPSAPHLREVMNGVRTFAGMRNDDGYLVVSDDMLELWKERRCPVAGSFLDYAVAQARVVFGEDAGESAEMR